MKIGDEITAIHRGKPRRATVCRLPDSNLGEWYGHEDSSFNCRYTDPSAGETFIVFTAQIEDEGVEWLPGWSDDNKAILSATNALRPDPPLKIDWSFNHNGGKLIR